MRQRQRKSSRSTPMAVAGCLAAVLLLTLGLAGCGTKIEKGGGASASSGKPMTLKVMEFNIEYGGTQVSFRKVVAAIKAADPDIVGVEEAETNTARLAKEAGYPYYNASM